MKDKIYLINHRESVSQWMGHKKDCCHKSIRLDLKIKPVGPEIKLGPKKNWIPGVWTACRLLRRGMF